MKVKSKIVEKGLSTLSTEELENIGDVIEDLKDDGKINGSVTSQEKSQEPAEKVIIQKETVKKKGGALKWIIIAIIVVIVVGGIILFAKPKGTTTFSASVLLEDIVEISELSTVTYTYNGVATAYDEDGNEKYYVGYEGTVDIGFDLKDIKIENDKSEKIVRITIPELKIQNINANIGKAEYIFVNQKYNTETVISEANQVAKNDLEAKAKEDEKMFTIARENAISTIEAWSEPILSQLPDGYKIVVE